MHRQTQRTRYYQREVQLGVYDCWCWSPFVVFRFGFLWFSLWFPKERIASHRIAWLLALHACIACIACIAFLRCLLALLVCVDWSLWLLASVAFFDCPLWLRALIVCIDCLPWLLTPPVWGPRADLIWQSGERSLSGEQTSTGILVTWQRRNIRKQSHLKRIWRAT